MRVFTGGPASRQGAGFRVHREHADGTCVSKGITEGSRVAPGVTGGRWKGDAGGKVCASQPPGSAPVSCAALDKGRDLREPQCGEKQQ